MKKLWVVKIGGNVVDDPTTLACVLAALAAHPEPLVVVHGGGKLATKLAEKLDVPQQMIEGRRVTNAATLDIAMMVYAGLINKQIVARLQAAGRNAIGLSGADGNAITATKRPITPIDFGFVGDLNPASVRVPLFNTLLQARLTPIFCALTHNGEGQMLNTNADTLAQAIAVALAMAPRASYQTQLLYLFEMKGVMRDIKDPNSLIEQIRIDEVEALVADGTISHGMVPKIRNAAEAVRHGVETVLIGQPAQLAHILQNKTDACTRVVA